MTLNIHWIRYICVFSAYDRFLLSIHISHCIFSSTEVFYHNFLCLSISRLIFRFSTTNWNCTNISGNADVLSLLLIKTLFFILFFVQHFQLLHVVLAHSAPSSSVSWRIFFPFIIEIRFLWKMKMFSLPKKIGLERNFLSLIKAWIAKKEKREWNGKKIFRHVEISFSVSYRKIENTRENLANFICLESSHNFLPQNRKHENVIKLMKN